MLALWDEAGTLDLACSLPHVLFHLTRPRPAVCLTDETNLQLYGCWLRLIQRRPLIVITHITRVLFCLKGNGR